MRSAGQPNPLEISPQSTGTPSRSKAVVTAQIARAAITSAVCLAIVAQSTTLD
jgi:hypothetical protein